MTDTVPASITGVTASCTAAGTASCGTNASAGNSVAFTGASVAAGAGHSLTITISGTVGPGTTGTLVNTAHVTVPGGAAYSDPSPANNSATDSDAPGTPVVDLAITKTDGKIAYVPGAAITYTLRGDERGAIDGERPQRRRRRAGGAHRGDRDAAWSRDWAAAAPTGPPATA